MERDIETMNFKITMTKSRQILGFCAICTAVAFVSVSADAQDASAQQTQGQMPMRGQGQTPAKDASAQQTQGQTPAKNVQLDLDLLRSAFEAADTSGDGRIDEGELAADTVAAFVAVDSNGDDRLSAEELREAGVASIGTLDVDKNESLTIVEVMNAKIVEFQNTDANGDGELTFEEISQFERRR